MQSTTASKTAGILRTIFPRFGLPKYVVSDNGPRFVSREMTDYFHQNGIIHIPTAPYHPPSNGQAENSVKTVKFF